MWRLWGYVVGSICMCIREEAEVGTSWLCVVIAFRGLGLGFGLIIC